MPSRNRGPNSAQLWGLDDATAKRPQIKPPRPLPVSTQATGVVPALTVHQPEMVSYSSCPSKTPAGHSE
jgi:hypothetical protein